MVDLHLDNRSRHFADMHRCSAGGRWNRAPLVVNPLQVIRTGFTMPGPIDHDGSDAWGSR